MLEMEVWICSLDFCVALVVASVGEDVKGQNLVLGNQFLVCPYIVTTLHPTVIDRVQCTCD